MYLMKPACKNVIKNINLNYPCILESGYDRIFAIKERKFYHRSFTIDRIVNTEFDIFLLFTAEICIAGVQTLLPFK